MCNKIVGGLALFCFAISEGLRNSKCGDVHITVSSLKDTYLELNWVTDCNYPGDTIPDFIIFSDKDIRDRNEDSAPLVKLRASDYPRGYYRTRIKFGQPWLPGNWEKNDNNLSVVDRGPQCFPYWIASVKGNFIIDSRCLAIQPTWMSDNRQIIGSQKIGSLFIPGTHNSGSFTGIASFLENYIRNQDRDIWTQLVFGIRYLDFRIGYYENEGFFINHDLVRVTKIVPLLKDIRRFVELAPSEIVILDFHRFPYPSNFSQALHGKFTDLVYDHLGDLALPSGRLQVGKGPTLNEIWTQNKNLIICYGDMNTVRNNFWLWAPIHQFWGNTKKPEELKSYLSRSINQHFTQMNPIWALMAELTYQPIDIFIRTNNIRKLADDINGKVTKWFRHEWSSEVNVVATDYFLGNDLIDVAIKANTRK